MPAVRSPYSEFVVVVVVVKGDAPDVNVAEDTSEAVNATRYFVIFRCRPYEAYASPGNAHTRAQGTNVSPRKSQYCSNSSTTPRTNQPTTTTTNHTSHTTIYHALQTQPIAPNKLETCITGGRRIK